MRTVTSSHSTQPDGTVIHIAAPPRRRARWVLMLGALALIFILAGLIGATIAAGAYYRSDYILPGVRVLEYDLADQTIAEATGTLTQGWAARTIAFESEHGSWTVAPGTIGIYLDAAATARRAHQQGRGTTDINEVLATLRGEVTIVPVWSIDLAATSANLTATAPRFARPAQDARLELHDGSATVTSANPGLALDVPATVAWLSENAAAAVLTGRAPLFYQPVPPAVTEADLAPLAQQTNQWLTNPLPLLLYDPVTNEIIAADIPAAIWRNWVTMAAGGAETTPPQLEVNVAIDQVEGFLRTGLAALPAGAYVEPVQNAALVGSTLQSRLFQPDTTPIELRVFHTDRAHVVQAGETMASIAFAYGLPYPWVQQANPGAGDFLGIGQTITIPSPDAFLPLPVVRNKRILVSLSEQRLWAYEDGVLRWEWPVSTGIASSPTSPGVFQIQTHDGTAYASSWDLWMPDFMGIYQPVPGVDFMNGFHGFPTRGGSQLLWTNDLGRPVTYGCILVSSSNSSLLYDWAETGVVVEIRR